MIHQEAIIQLILQIAVSPNVALCVEARFVKSSHILYITLKVQAAQNFSIQNEKITFNGLAKARITSASTGIV